MHTEVKTNGPGGAPADRKSDRAPEEGKQFLVFKEGNFTLAIRLASIKKLYDAQSFPPRTPGTRMLDLHDLMGAEYVAHHGYWIEMEVGSKRYLMPVEDVEGIRELSLAVVMAYPPVLRRREVEYLRSIFFDGLRMIVELDALQLAETDEGGGLTAPPGIKGRDSGRVEAPFSLKPAGAPESGRTKVLFEGGGKLWSLDLDAVVQIINKDEVHPLPAAGRRIRGAVYYSEQAVPVLSPADLNWIVLGQAGEEGGDFSLVIVAETARGLLGFGCDRVVQMSKREVGEAPREAARAHGPASGARVYELEAEKVLQYLS